MVKRFAVVTTLVLAWIALFATPARAQEPGVYANWNVSGGSGAWTGAGTPAAGFPVASVTSDASSVTTPSGTSTFLGPQTPIAAEYGSSQSMGYMNISTAAGFASSTTTLTFASPTPAEKWAFALGDVDADFITVTATDANGDPVATSDLGFEDVFNYCDVTPKPGSCTGGGPFDDVPTWDPTTATLTGNGTDTFGAAAWFQPTAAIQTLTFTFSRISGSPIFQLWLASHAVTVSTVVAGTTPDCPAGLQLDDAAGQPILDSAGQPVIVQTDAGGSATFPAVADGDYQAELLVPDCAENTGPAKVPFTVDTANGPVVIPPGTFTVFVPTLPSTGSRTTDLLITGLALCLAGVGLVRVAGIRRRSRG